jgi:hypothetical protein
VRPTPLNNKGYDIVAPDDCWASARAPNGTIIADAKSFPDGMAAPLAYITSKGLRPGIYTAIGNTTCAHRPGSAGFEAIDAATYASWGVVRKSTSTAPARRAHNCDPKPRNPDPPARPTTLNLQRWAKIDNCDYPHWDPARLYGAWAAALDAQPYRIPVAGKAVLNFSASRAFTASRRVGWDVSASWASLTNLALMGEPFWAQATAGDADTGVASFWTDLELLQVGHSSLSVNETAAHFWLWCAMHAPLMLSSRVDTLQPWHIALLTNPEALAIDADAGAGQARRVALALIDAAPALPLAPTVLSCSAPPPGVLAPGQAWALEPAAADAADGGAAPPLFRVVLGSAAGAGAAGLCLQTGADNRSVVVDACPAAPAARGALWAAPAAGATGLLRSATGAGCVSVSPGSAAALDHGCGASWHTLVTRRASGQLAFTSQVPGDDFIGYPLCFDAALKTHSEVWAAPLAGGDVSVLLLNPTRVAATVTAAWAPLAAALGVAPFADAAAVRDVGARADAGPAAAGFTAALAPHSAVFLRVTPKR